MTLESCDVLVIGGGIAGASIAYRLAPHARTVLLEREPQPGYHSSGRSAAMFMETYGSPQVRALTRASRAFLAQPPDGFAAHPLLSPRTVMTLARADELDALARTFDDVAPISPGAQRITVEQACARVPILRRDAFAGALVEPAGCDIDTHALLQGFLRGVRTAGGAVHCDAEVTAIARQGAGWRVHTARGAFDAAVLVNAAGAWCDRIAALAGVRAIGLQPKRRAAFTFSPGDGVDVRGWPMFMSIDESWYVKPDAGVLLGSPANADPADPQDVQPEELDIAIGIDRIESATTVQIRRPLRTWAGLRSFVADGDLVGGFAPDAPGFFWVAAQGGYGFQTCAAMSEACAALLLGRPMSEHLQRFGINAAVLSPGRATLARA
ncbi:MAG TPA: FAD-dependent oxidoreductase [Quisquiliibacterium sp.]|nr:FAD-dependent oxidoreductase [Quisquiliibacterium sp.]